MKDATRFVMQLYQFTLLVRDTFFYGFHKEFYDLTSYRMRARQLADFLKEESLIPQIMKRLPDGGKKIQEKLKGFMTLFYEEGAKAFQIKEDKLVFVLPYIHLLYDSVIVLHEIFTDVLRSYLKSPTIQDQIEVAFEPVINHDQLFTKSLVLLGLVNEIDFHSSLLKQAILQQEKDPSMNPKTKANIEKRLQFFTHVLLDQKQRFHTEDVGLKNAYEEAEKLVFMIQGKIPTPLKEGPQVVQGKPTGVLVNGEFRMFVNEVIGMVRNQITLVRNIHEQEWLQAFNELKTSLEDTKTNGPLHAA